jgi:hypothetical protein
VLRASASHEWTFTDDCELRLVHRLWELCMRRRLRCYCSEQSKVARPDSSCANCEYPQELSYRQDHAKCPQCGDALSERRAARDCVLLTSMGELNQRRVINGWCHRCRTQIPPYLLSGGWVDGWGASWIAACACPGSVTANSHFLFFSPLPAFARGHLGAE